MAYNFIQLNPLTSEYCGENRVVEIIDGIPYVVIELKKTNQFAYMCEEQDREIPIYLKVNNEYQKFIIGKTHILAAKDIEITGIKIPDEIKFTFDYICEE